MTDYYNIVDSRKLVLQIDYNACNTERIRQVALFSCVMHRIDAFSCRQRESCTRTQLSCKVIASSLLPVIRRITFAASTHNSTLPSPQHHLTCPFYRQTLLRNRCLCHRVSTLYVAAVPTDPSCALLMSATLYSIDGNALETVCLYFVPFISSYLYRCLRHARALVSC